MLHKQCLPNTKVHGAIIGPIWGRQDPGGPHVGPMNLAIWAFIGTHFLYLGGEDGQRLVQSCPKQEGVLPRVALGVHQLKMYFTRRRRCGDVKQRCKHTCQRHGDGMTARDII